MAVQWTEDLSVGVRQIDEQHRTLFQAVDRLFEAMRAGRGREHVEQTLQFLQGYVATHFDTEEQHMAAHDYPGLADHRAHHQAFVQDFLALRADFQQHGPSASLTIAVQRRLCDWLRNHISSDDLAMGKFLQARRVG